MANQKSIQGYKEVGNYSCIYYCTHDLFVCVYVYVHICVYTCVITLRLL